MFFACHVGRRTVNNAKQWNVRAWLAFCGFACNARTLKTHRSLVLCVSYISCRSSPRIFEQMRNCSQRMQEASSSPNEMKISTQPVPIVNTFSYIVQFSQAYKLLTSLHKNWQPTFKVSRYSFFCCWKRFTISDKFSLQAAVSVLHRSRSCLKNGRH